MQPQPGTALAPPHTQATTTAHVCVPPIARSPCHLTCSVPMPNTNLPMLRRRSNDSSSPMLNSRNTTPSSARWRIDSTSWMMPRAAGPTSAPPACGSRGGKGNGEESGRGINGAGGWEEGGGVRERR